MRYRFFYLSGWSGVLFLCAVAGLRGQQQQSPAAVADKLQARDSASTRILVPRLVAFNGILKDVNNRPLSGVVGVRFALYKDQEGGAPLWTEIQNLQSDEQGRYSVLLGATEGDGVPIELFASGESRWLGVQVQLQGEEEKPRILLVSVPYALKAADADTLGGKPASAFVVTNEGQPDSHSTKTQSQKSALTSETPETAAVSGTGTLNRVAKWSETNATLVDSSIYDNGNVGIGTTMPGAPLSIRPNSNSNQLHLEQNNVGPGTSNPTADDGYTFFADSAGGHLKINRRANNTDSTYMTLLNGGNVGIGTMNPIEKLEVTGTARMGNGVRANGPFLSNLMSSGGIDYVNGTMRFVNWGGTPNSYAAYQFFQQTSDASSTRTPLYIDTSANVGIGTTVPVAPLSIRPNSNSNQLHLEEENVGPGTGNPTRDDGYTFFADSVGGHLKINRRVNGTDSAYMTLLNGGNVGIGTTSPIAKLDVQGGQINASGGLCIGGVCQTSGTALNSAATRGIVYVAGCDTCSVLNDTDDQKTIYINVIGPMTIQEVRCFSDAGTPIINIQRDDGSPDDVLGSDLTCTTTGATTTSFRSGENVLNLNDKLDFVMTAAGGTTRRVTISIKAIVN